MTSSRFFTPLVLLAAALCWLGATPTPAVAAGHPAMGATGSALQPPPPPPPPPARPSRRPVPPPPPPPARATAEAGQAVNVQIELTIREEGGETAAAGKTVTLIAADHRNTMIRSIASTAVGHPSPEINVDASPEILPGARVRLGLGLEYAIPQAASAEATFWSLSQHMSLILQSGKPLVVSKTADPRSNRQAVVEVTATILK